MNAPAKHNLKAYLASLEKKRQPVYKHKAANSTGYHVDVVEVDGVVKGNVYSNYYGDNPSKVLKSVTLGKYDGQSDAELQEFAATVLKAYIMEINDDSRD